MFQSPPQLMKNHISVYVGASYKGFSALCLAVILLIGNLFQVSTVNGSSFEFDIYGADPGYSGKLFLAEASNVNGNVNDVLGGYVITPNIGKIIYDPSSASTFGPLEWDQISGLTFFHLSWFDGVGNHAIVGIDSIRGIGGGYFDATFGAHWAPPPVPASAPDGGWTLLMLLISLVLICFIPFRRATY